MVMVMVMERRVGMDRLDIDTHIELFLFRNHYLPGDGIGFDIC